MGRHIGSNFDDFLDQEGVLAEAEATAVKRALAYQLEELMKAQKLSKTQSGCQQQQGGQAQQ